MDTRTACTRNPNAVWSTCKCDACHRHNARVQAHRLHNPRAFGPTNDEALAALDRLVEDGFRTVTIARATGQSETHISIMKGARARGESPTLRHATRAALVAMDRNRPQDATVLGHGAARRLQALAAIGWPMGMLAREVDMSKSTLQHYRVHRSERIPRAAHEAICEVYDRVWSRPPVATTPDVQRAITRAKNEAKAYGWASPLAWDDEALDDLDASPWTERDDWVTCSLCEGTGKDMAPSAQARGHKRCTGCKGEGERPEKRPSRSNAIDVAEVRLLASAGSNWEDLGKRLGVDPESIQTRLHRDGERALLRTIVLNSVKTAQDMDSADLYAPQRKRRSLAVAS